MARNGKAKWDSWTLVWETKEDSWGKSLTCVVNGRAVFAKRSKLDPCGRPSLPLDARRLTERLEDAAAANMNLIRVWGGGAYESDWFYDECDRLGLLVWQDFMFSCATYPASPAFLDNVADEVEHQVKRLKNHASLALFCGNNEDVGALKWFPETRGRTIPLSG